VPICFVGATQLTVNAPPIEPYTGPCRGWRATHNATWAPAGPGAIRIHIGGTYAEAAVTYNVTLGDGGSMDISYTLTWQAGALIPRQLGLAFTLPPHLALLTWRRRGQFSSYPSAQIGRPIGDNVPAAPGARPRGRETPTGPWGQDTSELGSRDFRSTKHNITAFRLSATTSSGDQQVTLTASPQQMQHVRAWVNSTAAATQGTGATYLLAAAVSNEGGNPFSRERVLPAPSLRPGAVYGGTVHLLLGKASL